MDTHKLTDLETRLLNALQYELRANAVKKVDSNIRANQRQKERRQRAYRERIKSEQPSLAE